MSGGEDRMRMYREAWETLVFIDATGEPCSAPDVAAMRGVTAETAGHHMRRLVDLGLAAAHFGERRIGVTVGAPPMLYTTTANGRRLLDEHDGGLWSDDVTWRRKPSDADMSWSDALLALDARGPFTSRDAAELRGTPPGGASTYLSRLSASGTLRATGQRRQNGVGRPATLYRLTDEGRRAIAAERETD